MWVEWAVQIKKVIFDVEQHIGDNVKSNDPRFQDFLLIFSFESLFGKGQSGFIKFNNRGYKQNIERQNCNNYTIRIQYGNIWLFKLRTY